MSTIQQSILNKSRKDKFLLVLDLPAILKRSNKQSPGDRATANVNLDTLQYSVYGSVVPESNIAAVQLPYGGQVAKVTSYARESYKPITVDFTIDNGYNNWWVLWYWLNVINDAKLSVYNANELVSTGPNATTLIDYQTNITVYGLDEYNNKKIQWNYTNAFITGLGGITYSYRDAEQIDSSFTFAFGQFDSKLLS